MPGVEDRQRGTIRARSSPWTQVNCIRMAVLGDYTAPGGGFYSMTTSQHVGLARRHADLVMHPKVWEVSPMSKDESPF